MAKLESSVTINAPMEKVFEYGSKPENLPEFWPSMIEIKNIKELPNGGYSYDFVYKMAGMRLTGSSEDTEFVPNERIVSISAGGIESTFTWTYEPEGGGTKVTALVEYKIPLPLLGKVAEAFIVKMNENESETILANLKARLEA